MNGDSNILELPSQGLPPLPTGAVEMTMPAGQPGAGKAFTPRDSLINSVIHRESGGNPKARGKAGEIGLMQILPATAAQYGVKPEQLSDPTINRQVGTRYLSDMLKRFKGNEYLALMAYNSGPERVAKGIFLPQSSKYATDILANAGMGGVPQLEAQPNLPQQTASNTQTIPQMVPPLPQFLPLQETQSAMSSGSPQAGRTEGEISNVSDPWERRALETGGAANELGNVIGSKSFGQGLGDWAYNEMPRSTAGAVADVGIAASPILGEELRMAGQGIKDLPVRRMLFKIAGALRGAEGNPLVQRLTGELRQLGQHLNPEGTAEAQEVPPLPPGAVPIGETPPPPAGPAPIGAPPPSPMVGMGPMKPTLRMGSSGANLSLTPEPPVKPPAQMLGQQLSADIALKQINQAAQWYDQHLAPREHEFEGPIWTAAGRKGLTQPFMAQHSRWAQALGMGEKSGGRGDKDVDTFYDMIGPAIASQMKALIGGRLGYYMVNQSQLTPHLPNIDADSLPRMRDKLDDLQKHTIPLVINEINKFRAQGMTDDQIIQQMGGDPNQVPVNPDAPDQLPPGFVPEQ